MTTNEPSPPETVEVAQVDRDAAAAYLDANNLSETSEAQRIYDALRTGRIDELPIVQAFARHRTTAESASCDASEEVVERVAMALWDASPYSDGSAWDHVSMRRYGGTSDTRKLYLTLARAAIAAVSKED